MSLSGSCGYCIDNRLLITTIVLFRSTEMSTETEVLRNSFRVIYILDVWCQVKKRGFRKYMYFTIIIAIFVMYLLLSINQYFDKFLQKYQSRLYEQNHRITVTNYTILTLQRNDNWRKVAIRFLSDWYSIDRNCQTLWKWVFFCTSLGYDIHH